MRACTWVVAGVGKVRGSIELWYSGERDALDLDVELEWP